MAVQPDGYLTLKGAGSVHIEGQTAPELKKTVITVALEDFEKPYFLAAGYVPMPSKYDRRCGLTVTGAVAIAGSSNDKAKHPQVVLFRPFRAGCVKRHSSM